MSKVLQIRNVPDDVHRALAVKAAKSGLSLSAYALRALTKEASKPSLDEFFATLPGSGADLEPEEIVKIIREDRASH